MKAHLRMVGCRLNQSEIDSMARQLEAMGHEIVTEPEEADHFILNTCAVTQEASKTSRKLVREFHRRNAQAQSTVTGCYAQIAPRELATLPGVTNVVSNADKDDLVSLITGEEIPVFDAEPIERRALERGTLAGRLGRTRAFVKAQDGCDNECTFCVTTIARGAGRSRPLDDLLREVQALHQLGYQEAVLTGVHLGSYGQDLGLADGLARLVRALLRHSDMPRLRLSSLEPWDLAPGFFDLWQDERLCRHLHLPLQSGCDATLKRMRRNTNQAEFRALIQAARAAIPGLRVTTDVIVGFPGESDAEFAISRDFIQEMNFDGLHVFRYSSRPGTPASRMKNQVDSQRKKARSADLLALSKSMEADFARQLEGTRQQVLWEQVIAATPDGFVHTGYTDNYMRVNALHPRDLSNRICAVSLGKFTAGAIHGTVEL